MRRWQHRYPLDASSLPVARAETVQYLLSECGVLDGELLFRVSVGVTEACGAVVRGRADAGGAIGLSVECHDGELQVVVLDGAASADGAAAPADLALRMMESSADEVRMEEIEGRARITMRFLKPVEESA